ncbi:MAG: hypothetical protein KAJ47_03210, partial [Candidatus Aenigmarchaeota archaeon]|nr:hypothetical protein [Candidatus Aenigmarchaeota archaeon]
MNKDTTYSGKYWLLFSVFTVAFAIMCASATVLATDKTFTVSTDAKTYSPSAAITISGTMYDGTAPAADGSALVLTLYNSTNTSISSNTGVTTTSNGTFTGTLTAPNAVGSYYINVSSGADEVVLSIVVSEISFMILDLVSNSQDSILNVSVGAITGSVDKASYVASKYGSFLYNNSGAENTYHILVGKDTTGEFAYLYMTDNESANFTSSLSINTYYKYLEQKSKLILNGTEFLVEHIDPDNGNIILVKKVNPIFVGGGNNEVFKILAIALNETKSVLTAKTLSFSYVNERGGSAVVYSGQSTFSDISDDSGMYSK